MRVSVLCGSRVPVRALPARGLSDGAVLCGTAKYQVSWINATAVRAEIPPVTVRVEVVAVVIDHLLLVDASVVVAVRRAVSLFAAVEEAVPLVVQSPIPRPTLVRAKTSR